MQKGSYPPIKDTDIIATLRRHVITGVINTILLWGLIILFLPRLWPEFSLALVCFLIGLLPLINWLSLLHYKSFKDINAIFLRFCTFDALILTAILYYVAELKALLLFIYLAPIILTAPIFSFRKIIILIPIYISFYLCLLLLEASSLIPTLHAPGIDIPFGYFWSLSGVGIILVVTVGIIIAKAISERREKEYELASAKDYTDNVIKSIIDSLIIVGLDGRIKKANRATCKLLGYKEEELLSKSVETIFAEEGKGAWMKRLMEEGSLRDYNLVYRTKKGEEIPVSLFTTVIKNEERKAVDILGIARDMRQTRELIANLQESKSKLEELTRTLDKKVRERTADLTKSQEASLNIMMELRKAKKELERTNKELKRNLIELEAANKELEAFSYSVSHDLRAPLRAIDGFSLVLLEEYSDKLDGEGRRLLGIVRESTGKMDRLINDILALSHLGRQEMRSSELDMGSLVKEIFEELRVTASERKLQFDLKIVPPVQGDEGMLRQALFNLLSNAIKFTRPKETAIIEVGCKAEENQNIYYIKDNGVGFDMQYVGKLFGVFQRLHSEEEFEGTGVGLAIVARIIHRHNGQVWAEGEVNKGATFYFTLPKGKGLSSKN